MKTLMTRLVFCAMALVLVSPALAQAPRETMWGRTDADGSIQVKLHFFWSKTCPHCARAQHFLEPFAAENPWLDLVSYEVSGSAANRGAFGMMAAMLGEEIQGVPTFFLCGEMIVGFDRAETTGAALAARAEACRVSIEEDLSVLPAARPATDTGVSLPIVGSVDAAALSLPVLTLVLAGVDAFNPCAFFVLLFLLSLLVHANSRGRMFLIGGTFVLFSGLLYFVFMAAWLNLFLVLEGIRAVTVVAGLVAVGFALFNIKDFFLFGRGPSLSIPKAAKPGLFARMRGLLSADNLPALMVGTVALAIAANAYELLCTSGFPLVYTRALTLNALSTPGYYLYLAFYNVIYVLPLLIIVIVFTVTLGAAKLSEFQGRVLKLMSGLMMLGLGLVLLAAPELLDNWLTAVALLVGAVVLAWGICAMERARVRG